MTETDRFVKEDGLDIDRRRTVDEDDEDDEEDDEEDEPVKVLEETAVFQEIFVWGHEAVPEADHPFVRGIEEWIAFADAVSRRPCHAAGRAFGNEIPRYTRLRLSRVMIPRSKIGKVRRAAYS